MSNSKDHAEDEFLITSGLELETTEDGTFGIKKLPEEPSIWEYVEVKRQLPPNIQDASVNRHKTFDPGSTS